MTLMANFQVSLLTGLNSAKNQPATSPLMAGGTSTFLQALDITASELPSQADLDGPIPSAYLASENAVLVLDGASMKPFNPIDDSTKENPVAPVADAVWLAHWFQNNAPVMASSPAPLVASGSNPVEPARMESAPKPLAMRSSESMARADVPISDQSKQSPPVLMAKPVNAGAHSPAATTSNASASLSLPTSFAAQATSQLVIQSAAQSVSRSPSIGSEFLEEKSTKTLPSDSGHLRPMEVLSKVPLDTGGSVKLGQAVGFKDFKDIENGRWLPVMPGSAPVRLDIPVVQNLPHQMLGKEAELSGLSPVAQGNLNLAEPAWMETAPMPLPAVSSEPISRTDLPISDKPQHIPWGLPDKPVTAGVTAPAATPSNAAVGSLLPTSSAIQATSQPASIEVVILDKKTPKNLSFESDRLKSQEVLSKVPSDIVGSVTWGQSVGSKGIKDLENDRWLPVMPGSGQVSWEPQVGQNLPNQTVGTESAPPGFSPDAQWTSDLADTVNQWVERSLLLAELTVPDAGQDSLQVRIELNGQEATVYFLTDHDQYRAAIESQIENLSDRLADQGLKLAGSFVGQGQSQNSPHQPSAHSMLSRRPESEPASAKGLSIDPVLRDMKSVPNGRVLDVFA